VKTLDHRWSVTKRFLGASEKKRQLHIFSVTVMQLKIAKNHK